MANTPILLPTGIDGHVPSIDTSNLARLWRKDQLYLGKEGLDKHIPKVEDLVYDRPNYTFEWVESIKPDYTPNLLPWTPRSANTDDNGNGTDALQSLGSGCTDTVRLLVNKSHMPHSCLVDQFNTLNIRRARYARVFRGTPAEPGYEVISMTFDASNNFVSYDVGFDVVETPDPDNKVQGYLQPFKTTFDLKQGESCTIVLYGEGGQHIGDKRVIVMESAWVQSMAADTKTVTGISMDTWFLSPSEPNVLEIPQNLMSNDIHAFGVVHYSDGSTKRYPAMDEEHFTILGMNKFIASMPVLREEVFLRYTLAPNEIPAKLGMSDDRTILEPFYIRTVAAKNEYSVRLWCFPVWIDAVSGYRLEWFFANLERKTIENVTRFVHLNTETNPGFNPKAYGLLQVISASINLSDISKRYHAHRHVQVFNLELLKEGTDDPTLWRINDDGQANIYGVGNMAQYVFVNQNLKRLRVDSGSRNLDHWLERFYYNANPLRDTFSEDAPPRPNYFSIEIPGSTERIERPIEDWNKEIVITGALKNTDTIFIRFLTHTNNQDQVLSIAGVPLRQVSAF